MAIVDGIEQSICRCGSWKPAYFLNLNCPVFNSSQSLIILSIFSDSVLLLPAVILFVCTNLCKLWKFICSGCSYMKLVKRVHVSSFTGYLSILPQGSCGLTAFSLPLHTSMIYGSSRFLIHVHSCNYQPQTSGKTTWFYITTFYHHIL